ncbi:MAG: peptidoglycan DD-metalloendopeptidase family protein, partial [Anaerolineales bacterium]
MNDLNKQARPCIAAGLFFILFACVGAQPDATDLPTAQVEQQVTQTPTSFELTTTPSAEPDDFESYTVVEGDTVESLAARFGLNPETVLWANYDQLFDNPDWLLPGMQLTMLPTDGIYHQVGGVDTVDSIAAFFGADIQEVIDWPGNQIDPENPVIFAGQWLMVPGGQRALNRRLMPNLPRFAMTVDAQEFGTGACPQNVSFGMDGDGVYAWPVENSEVVGEGFWSAHPGVDLLAGIGEAVRASDAGVVTFSGWSNFGYGYTVMIDHGNGDFTLYSGLGQV